MTPAARIAAVIDILDSLYADGAVTSSAAQALRSSMQRRRYAGSGDRNAIGDLFWQVQRGLSRLCWHLESCNAEITGRHLVLAALVLMERQHDALAGLFTTKMCSSSKTISSGRLCGCQSTTGSSVTMSVTCALAVALSLGFTVRPSTVNRPSLIQVARRFLE